MKKSRLKEDISDDISKQEDVIAQLKVKLGEEESKLADTYEKAASAIKFTEEEMKELDGIQSTYFEVQNKFGAVAVTRLRLEQQLNDMNQYTDELRKNFIDSRFG